MLTIMRRNFNGAVLALVMSALAAAPAMARGNDLIIKDGMGEEVTVKHGFFGRGTTIVKDRLGNGYASNTGLFGTKEQQVQVLGNSLERKKGLFGGTSVQGSTIFGDQIKTKKGIFGRRTTTVDVSGTSNVLKALWQKHGPELMGKTPAVTPPPSVQSTPAPTPSDTF